MLHMATAYAGAADWNETVVAVPAGQKVLRASDGFGKNHQFSLLSLR